MSNGLGFCGVGSKAFLDFLVLCFSYCKFSATFFISGFYWCYVVAESNISGAICLV